MAELVLGVVDVLSDFEVSFATAGKLVVERHREIGHLLLVDQVMRDVAQRLHYTVILTRVDQFADSKCGELLLEIKLVHRMLVELPPGGLLVLLLERPLLAPPLFHLVHHVHDPGGDRFHQHLCAFPFQECKHVEVAVAFGGLRPEFADDLYHGLNPQAIDFNGRKMVVYRLETLLVGAAVEVLPDFA